MNGLGRSKRTILNNVVAFYLNSRDFNGLCITERLSPTQRASITDLVRDGLVQVVSDADGPNPHIRPWKSLRGTDSQVEDVESIGKPDFWGIGMYPTPKAMLGRLTPEQFQGEPFRLRMAQGNGSLELAYFSLDILEAYRNDPMYTFEASDFQVKFHVTNEAYEDPHIAEKDKVIAARIGFAYDGSTLTGPNLKRYVAVFLNDLAKLTPEHQRRWESYELTNTDNVFTHPVWMDRMMGKWTDGLGPFAKILLEMEAINELFTLVFGQKLFRHTTRPRDWGWMIRPSVAEWEIFVHITDKLISDNLRDKAFNAARVPDRDENGEKIGTLKRLWLLAHTLTRAPGEEITKMLEPMFEIRRSRQRPAHQISTNATDGALLLRQVETLENLGETLEIVRRLLSSEKQAACWSEPRRLKEHAYRM